MQLASHVYEMGENNLTIHIGQRRPMFLDAAANVITLSTSPVSVRDSESLVTPILQSATGIWIVWEIETEISLYLHLARGRLRNRSSLLKLQ